MRGEQNRRKRVEEVDEDSRKARLVALRKFLDYRGRGEVSEDAWAEIVDADTFELRLPVTPYRSYDPAEVERPFFQGRGGDDAVLARVTSSSESGSSGSLNTQQSSSSSENLVVAAVSARSPSSQQKTRQVSVESDAAAARKTKKTSHEEGHHLCGGGSRRVCKGIRGLVFDTASFAVMLQSIGVPRRRGHELVHCVFELLDGGDASHEVLFSPSRVLASWRMKTVNAVRVGALGEAEKRGMLEAWFTAENKLARLDLCFDVLAFTRELQRCRGGAGPDVLELVPNTLQRAVRDLQRDDDLFLRFHKDATRRRTRLQTAASEDDAGAEDQDAVMMDAALSSSHEDAAASYRKRPRVVALASRPHLITHTNLAFLELTEFTAAETIGKSLRIIQGPATDAEVVEDFCADVAREIPTSMIVVNYTRTKERFINYLRVYPLFANGRSSEVTHFLGELERVDEETVQAIENTVLDGADDSGRRRQDRQQDDDFAMHPAFANDDGPDGARPYDWWQREDGPASAGADDPFPTFLPR